MLPQFPRKTLRASLAAAVCLLTASSFAPAQAADLDGSVNDYGATSCPSLYLGNMPPEIDPRIADGAVEHCHPNNAPGYDTEWSFSDLVSPVYHAPIYAAEILTSNNVAASKGVSRKGVTFFSDPSIPDGYQGAVKDYVHSGYDRGHLANWADSANPQTFELSNIIPQDANDNRELWERIERTVRGIASSDGAVYVVSGPVYGAHPEHLKGTSQILVPNYLFKCVVGLRYHGCYMVANAPGSDYVKVPFRFVEAETGVKAFPSYDDQDSVVLPDIQDRGHGITPVDSLAPHHSGAFGERDK